MVVARSAREDVIARMAADRVVAQAPVDLVVAKGADNDVVAVRANSEDAFFFDHNGRRLSIAFISLGRTDLCRCRRHKGSDQGDYHARSP